MEKPNHNHYKTEINKIISFLERPSSDRATLDKIQSRLDKLADQFQGDNELGKEQFKLYQAQAMLSYRLDDFEKARQFIQESINVRGDSYELAEQMLQHIAGNTPRKSIKLWVTLIVAPYVSLILILIVQTTVHGIVAKANNYTAASSSSLAVTLVNIFSVLLGACTLLLFY